MITKDNKLLREHVKTFVGILESFTKDEQKLSMDRAESWKEMSEWHLGRSSAYRFCAETLTRYLKETE
jgi:hypothetical protein